MKNGKFIVALIFFPFLTSCGFSEKKNSDKVEEQTPISVIVPTFDLEEFNGKSSQSIGGRELGRAFSGEKLSDRFALKNNSGVTIVITEVTTNCGCIQLTYDKKPIVDGGESIVSYTYNTAGEIGQQLSEVIIHTNIGKYSMYIDLFVK